MTQPITLESPSASSLDNKKHLSSPLLIKQLADEAKALAAVDHPHMSQRELEEYISKILLDVGLDMSKVQQLAAQISTDQAKITQNLANSAEETTKKLVETYDKMRADQDSNEHGFWGILGQVLSNKGVQIGITIAIGLCFCETPIGFAILAGVVVLQASGALDALTDKLADALGGGPVAHLVAAIIITVLLTGGAGVAEGLGSAVVSGIAKGMTKAAAEEGAEAAARAETNMFTKGGRFFSNTTAQVAIQSITQTQLVYNLLVSVGFSKETATFIAAIANIVLSLALMGAALKGSTSTMFDMLTNMKNIPVFAKAVKWLSTGFQGGTTLASGAYGIKEGVTNIDMANMMRAMATEMADVNQKEMISKLFGDLIKVTNENITSVLKDESNIFSIDFATAWKAVSQGVEISA